MDIHRLLDSPPSQRVHGTTIYHEGRKMIIIFGGMREWKKDFSPDFNEYQTSIDMYSLEKQRWFSVPMLYNLCEMRLFREKMFYVPYLFDNYLLISGIGMVTSITNPILLEQRKKKGSLPVRLQEWCHPKEHLVLCRGICTNSYTYFLGHHGCL